MGVGVERVCVVWAWISVLEEVALSIVGKDMFVARDSWVRVPGVSISQSLKHLIHPVDNNGSWFTGLREDLVGFPQACC